MPIRSLVLFLVLLVLTPFARSAEANGPRVLSFVLLSKPELPSPDAFRANLERRLKGRLAIDAMEADSGKVILLRTRGGTVMVGLIDAPLPKGTVDDLCPSTWYWPKACEVTAAHRAHAVVSVLGTDLDRLDAHLLQTDAVAALMDANALGSYWGASLHPKESFLALSAESTREVPPAWLWVNFRLSKDANGLSLSTQGMEAFDLREIETKDVKRSGRDVFFLLEGLAQYLISKGPVIKDGETIGDSPALNIRVRQGPSYWRDGATVYRVLFPNP
ncbi:MAG: DUF4261 domain-containing protein [Proteobacteria bacterium]|nr:DUF4261 domain-containing protein [Burkholderiaceae bacterium]MCH8855536.1 DUF4261 domain-containing protein [Pseudomonadota bacterium]